MGNSTAASETIFLSREDKKPCIIGPNKCPNRNCICTEAEQCPDVCRSRKLKRLRRILTKQICSSYDLPLETNGAKERITICGETHGYIHVNDVDEGYDILMTGYGPRLANSEYDVDDSYEELTILNFVYDDAKYIERTQNIM
ncbi:Uncharacterized protein Fot_40335 [Forsythia ovata]|uniref:Uncharacterized protein n=1 Tax=Forsythia ovata TaxID=205694 RepID=A0ABD1S751_9LAMI